MYNPEQDINDCVSNFSSINQGKQLLIFYHAKNVLKVGLYGGKKKPENQVVVKELNTTLHFKLIMVARSRI